MKQVRNGLFETNSSSTHSLIIDTSDKFARLGKDMAIVEGELRTLSEEQIKLKRQYDLLCDSSTESKDFDTIYDKIEKALGCDPDSIYLDVESWRGEYLECESGLFVSPSGDEIEWIAKYGNDW